MAVDTKERRTEVGNLASIRSEDFASASEQRAMMPAESLIRKFAEEERSRDEKTLPKKDREISIGTRSFPQGMAMSLSQIGRSEKQYVQTITKCLSHGVASWFYNLPEVSQANTIYAEVADICSDHAYDDLQRDLSAVRYEFKHPAKVETMTGATTIKTIAWVATMLSNSEEDGGDEFQTSAALGASIAKILCVGFCRHIALNRRGWADGTIDSLLVPEVNHFLWYLRERLIMLEAHKRLALTRVERDTSGRTLFNRKQIQETKGQSVF